MPNKTDWHPELDTSLPLNDFYRNKYQQLVGIGIWIITIGRVDVTFAVITLVRFNHRPTEEHLKNITRVFAYVNKFPKCCLLINSKTLDLNVAAHIATKTSQFSRDMTKYYADAILEDDPSYPTPIGNPVQATIFVDSNVTIYVM